MTPLEHALALAAKGCPVFPIDAGTKKPTITGWPDRATTDETTIRKWWTKWPDANIGIHTRGLLVIDIDGPTGQANLDQLREHRDIPDTLRINSGNTEPHHYQLLYKLPDGYRAWNKALDKFKGYEQYDKIDIKSTRGQVVGPGSVHKTGGVYRWATEPSHVPSEATPAPDWMLAAFCTPDATEGQERPEMGSDEELFQVLINRYPLTGTGQRNHQMTALVGWLVGKGHDQGRVLRLATAWVRHFSHVYSTPASEAEQEVIALTFRTFNNLSAGRFHKMTDHQEESVQQGLLSPVEQWFHRLLSPRHRNQPPSESTEHVLCSQPGVLARSRFSGPEGNFLLCLLLHCQYEILTKGYSDRVLMTDRQLISIYQKVFGKGLGWRSFYDLKRKFITRPGTDGNLQKATMRELLVMEEAGDYGKASSYQLTGILSAFESLQGVNDGRVARTVATGPESAVCRSVREGRRARPASNRQEGRGRGCPAAFGERQPLVGVGSPSFGGSGAVHDSAVPTEQPRRTIQGQPGSGDRRRCASGHSQDTGAAETQGAEGVPGPAGPGPGCLGGGDHAGGGAAFSTEVDPGLERLIAELAAYEDEVR